MAKKAKTQKVTRIENRKARRNYEILERLEVGVALLGTEIKALREGRVSLDEAYIRVKKRSFVLEQSHFGEYSNANIQGHPAVRPRQLLAHKNEIRKWTQELKQQGLTIVPLVLYFSGRWAKLEIALVRGRREHDKRQMLKKRDADRDIRRATK